MTITFRIRRKPKAINFPHNPKIGTIHQDHSGNYWHFEFCEYTGRAKWMFYGKSEPIPVYPVGKLVSYTRGK